MQNTNPWGLRNDEATAIAANQMRQNGANPSRFIAMSQEAENQRRMQERANQLRNNQKFGTK